MARDDPVLLYRRMPKLLPGGGLISDGHGNLFGTADPAVKAAVEGNGTVFELTPAQGGSWNFSMHLHLQRPHTMRSVPVFGQSHHGCRRQHLWRFGGAKTYAGGNVFKLTAIRKRWNYTRCIASFRGRAKAPLPTGTVVMDAAGNVYSTARYGVLTRLERACGTVWQITP